MERGKTISLHPNKEVLYRGTWEPMILEYEHTVCFSIERFSQVVELPKSNLKIRKLI